MKEIDIKPKVLLIDDDSDFLSDWNLMLKQTYSTYQAENSRQALRLFRKIQPDLCLIDVHLPAYLNEKAEWEGLFLMEEIRRSAGGNLPVILMSRFPLPESPIATGGIPFIRKPFIIGELIQQIENLLSGWSR